MDLQGTPIGSTNQGLKNTTDPQARVPVSESAGPVASDSLAAESYNKDEGFAENRNAAPSGASGASSTLNTTDISAARTLDSASNARERGTQGEGEKYAEGLGGQPSFPGNTNSLGYTGGPSSGSSAGQSGGSTGQSSGSTGQSSGSTGQSGSSADLSSSSGADTSSSGKTTRSGNTYGGTSTDSPSDGSGRGSGDQSSNVDTAPSYVADVYLGDTNKPKGKNLTEDENLEGKTNTDFEIGDNNDPGRAALQNFEKANSTGQAGGAQTEIDGENTYDSLKSDGRA